MPVLQENDEWLTQSRSILRYLGRKYDLDGDNQLEAFKCDENLEIMSDFREEVRDTIGKKKWNGTEYSFYHFNS